VEDLIDELGAIGALLVLRAQHVAIEAVVTHLVVPDQREQLLQER
jgi:hypothetical protein